MECNEQFLCCRLCGVDMQSQTAYELVAQGPIRPLDSKIPVVYGIKCVDLTLPDFTIGRNISFVAMPTISFFCNLELHTINEHEMYLKTLIHEIGVKMRSTAHCTGIQCIRHSCFTLDNALLRKHWTMQHILTNIEDCWQLINENGFIKKQESASLLHSL